MRVWLKIAEPVARGFYSGPAPVGLPDLRYDRLLSVGPYRRPLFGETANQSITLDNSDGGLTTVFADLRMIGKAAEVHYEKNGGDQMLFSGIVDTVSVGAEIQIGIVAGLSQPETMPVNLRSSTIWSRYPSVYTLPQGYGRFTMSPQPYDDSGRRWFLLDHPVQAIESVTVLDKPVAYDQSGINQRDESGRGVAILDLFDRVENAEDIRVTLRGKMHPTTGELMTNPATVLWDILSNINGGTLAESTMDDFRLACIEQKLSVEGMLSGDYGATRDAITDILASAGAVYSAGMPGLARLFPVNSRTSAEPLHYAFPVFEINGEPSADAETEIYTSVRVRFGYNYSIGDYTKSLTLRAASQEEWFGENTADLNLSWCQSARQAESVGTRWLQWHSRPRWSMQWQA